MFPAAFTPSEELANEVLSAAERSGEKLWRLPIEESYWESMKSGVADMVNTGPSQGGAITAALFLKQVNINFIFLELSEKEKSYLPSLLFFHSSFYVFTNKNKLLNKLSF